MNTKRHSFQRGFLPMVVIVIGAIIAGLIIYNVTTRLIHHSPAAPVAITPTAASPNTAPSTASPTAAPGDSAKTNSKNCGTDMQCFITQAATCGPASVEFSTVLYEHTITAKYVLTKTARPSICSFSDSTYGTKQVCSVPANDLVALFTKWKAGTFNSGDLSGYACTITSPDGTSFDTSPTSDGSAVATHGYSYSYTDGVGGSLGVGAFSYKVLAVGDNSMTLSFSNNQTNQSKVITAQLNVPVVFAQYTITLTGIDQGQASFTLKE